MKALLVPCYIVMSFLLTENGGIISVSAPLHVRVASSTWPHSETHRPMSHASLFKNLLMQNNSLKCHRNGMKGIGTHWVQRKEHRFDFFSIFLGEILVTLNLRIAPEISEFFYPFVLKLESL